jgi:ABC-type polysaccharide transport system permease subunit
MVCLVFNFLYFDRHLVSLHQNTVLMDLTQVIIGVILSLEFCSFLCSKLRSVASLDAHCDLSVVYSLVDMNVAYIHTLFHNFN